MCQQIELSIFQFRFVALSVRLSMSIRFILGEIWEVLVLSWWAVPINGVYILVNMSAELASERFCFEVIFLLAFS